MRTTWSGLIATGFRLINKKVLLINTIFELFTHHRLKLDDQPLRWLVHLTVKIRWVPPTLSQYRGCLVGVTPRTRGYGDVTATYIRRTEIPSHIYAKHQYRQESECESIVVIYIPKEKYKYIVITE